MDYALGHCGWSMLFKVCSVKKRKINGLLWPERCVQQNYWKVWGETSHQRCLSLFLTECDHSRINEFITGVLKPIARWPFGFHAKEW